MQRIFTQTYHVPGTLAADLGIRFTVPTNCQLVHVSAVGSNSYAAGLELGTSADADAYLEKCSIGVSGTPVEKGRSNFVGSQYPHITDGTIFVITLDYNYNGGGAANASANVTIVLTFTEG